MNNPAPFDGLQIDIQGFGEQAIKLTIKGKGINSFWTMVPNEKMIHSFRVHKKRVTSHTKIKPMKEIVAVEEDCYL